VDEQTVSSAMIRRRSHFSGRVQGVGFRYTVQALAKSFPSLHGYVRNLPDGRVELVVEGDESEIDRMLQVIAEKMEGFIKNRADAESPPTGEFTGFSIRR
jgi:acylphosphatase